MNLITVAEHSFDKSLLPDEPMILDLGCRGFEFSGYFKRNEKYQNVYCVDIDELDEGFYDRCGITNYSGKCKMKAPDDKQATTLIPATDGEIPCYTLADYMQKSGVKFWDLIKMDIEGSEYQVIMSMLKPPAKQLSVEFHLHTNVYTSADVVIMIQHLHNLGYKTIQHELTAQHGAGYNYWDSLFILET